MESAKPTASPEQVRALVRLHVGCGRARLAGWINIDAQALPGVDVVADVTSGLDCPDGGAEAIFAEHFLEHLPLQDALTFLGESHRALAPGCWLRLSTPNLDWVWSTHYTLEADAPRKRAAAIMLNRAFRGWRHQFLWNREMLEEALAAHGFDELRWCAYGESDLDLFRGLERHDRYEDSPALPHVLIVEARKGSPQPARLAALRALVEHEFLRHLSD
jgi:predicted SAM-dependent methyltransferase